MRSADDDGAGQPEIDPDVLEELEFWTGPDPPEGPAEQRAPESGGGSVVLVGTPIGNLGDLSPRAVATLRSSDVIYCEDTRHSRKLLSHAGISGVPLRSLHQHNEEDRIAEILDTVEGGGTVAVVSDAGMPSISDPGRRVVAAAVEAGVVVTVVPGPSALLAALVTSGLPTDRFCFEGFLPRSARDRRMRFETLAQEPRTTVLYEAPGRVPRTLADLAVACGENRQVAVSRELTKLHEETWRGSLAEALRWAGSHPLRGEVVIVLAGADPAEATTVSDAVLTSALAERLGQGEPTRGVVDDIAAAFEVPRKRVYSLALATRGTSSDRPLPASESE
jgi:16S rRNA (cytidine1402-2'-O)-methyltransferase